MSAQVFGGEFLVEETARTMQSYLAAVDDTVTARQTFTSLTLRADPGNDVTVWLGRRSTLTPAADRIGFLHPSEALTVLPDAGVCRLEDYFLVAAAGTARVYAHGMAP